MRDAQTEGQVQGQHDGSLDNSYGWQNWKLIRLEKKKCSIENRDFIHTSYTKIHCFISQFRNEVLPLQLHKHGNSESDPLTWDIIVDFWDYSRSQLSHSASHSSLISESPDISHNSRTSVKQKLEHQTSNAALKQPTKQKKQVGLHYCKYVTTSSTHSRVTPGQLQVDVKDITKWKKVISL